MRERGTLRRAPRCQPQTDTEFFIPRALRNPVLPQSSYPMWILRVLLFLSGHLLLWFFHCCSSLDSPLCLSLLCTSGSLLTVDCHSYISIWYIFFVVHFLVLVVSGGRINPALKLRVLERALLTIMDPWGPSIPLLPSGLPPPDTRTSGW